jgi:uncharacterized protein
VCPNLARFYYLPNGAWIRFAVAGNCTLLYLDTTASMVWSEVITVMLHTHAKWGTFTSRPIPPATASEVMLAVSCDQRETVDVMSKAAAANGGKADINPVKDLGFMYNRSLADPDGHVWEAVWMNPAAMTK